MKLISMSYKLDKSQSTTVSIASIFINLAHSVLKIAHLSISLSFIWRALITMHMINAFYSQEISMTNIMRMTQNPASRIPCPLQTCTMYIMHSKDFTVSFFAILHCWIQEYHRKCWPKWCIIFIASSGKHPSVRRCWNKSINQQWLIPVAILVCNKDKAELAHSGGNPYKSTMINWCFHFFLMIEIEHTHKWLVFLYIIQ